MLNLVLRRSARAAAPERPLNWLSERAEQRAIRCVQGVSRDFVRVEPDEQAFVRAPWTAHSPITVTVPVILTCRVM